MLRLRSFLLWLVVLAVPLQGLAAATMLNCAAMHGAATAVLERAGHGDQAHEHEDAHAHAAVAAHDESAADPGLAHAADHKCSACAACHASIGLPAALPPLPAFDLGEARAAAPAPGVEAFLTGGLERPPRSAHA